MSKSVNHIRELFENREGGIYVKKKKKKNFVLTISLFLFFNKKDHKCSSNFIVHRTTLNKTFLN